ncbi:MAG: TetR/AcrR family transcriptional regulator, partial [Pleurocapsa sp. SU_196_0]|nr:TetR/AcrR family transcriptional regulator [Pleurocapsa sp. SU_196_0]
VEARYRAAIVGRVGALERLHGILEAFAEMVLNPPVRGGCPMLNAAVEADDAMPVLRDRVRRAMDGWRTTVKGIVERGLLEGQIRVGVNADELSSVLFSTLEGAVMLSKLYRDAVHIERAIVFLRSHLETLKPAP